MTLHPTAARYQQLLHARGVHVEVRMLPDSARTAPEAAAAIGVEPARGTQVRELTGYAIGGIPPIGHDAAIPVLLDTSLQRFDQVWAAAGHPHAVFPIRVPALIAAVPHAELTEV